MRRVAAGVLLLALATSGCGLGSHLGTPGGSGPAYHVDAVFADVLDLVPRASVRVGDVTVGSVESIRLVDYQAKVRLRIRTGVDLPANAVATLRQTSLLGEKFIELSAPASGASGRLADGAVIPELRTDRNPEVEEVFSALSALLSGGGLPELETISVELTKALAGREAQVHSVLTRLDTFVGALDARKGDIVRAIDSLRRLSTTLAQQRVTIGEALDAFAPAVHVLADQRSELVRLLGGLDRLSQVGVRVIKASGDDTLADLRLLRPILDQVVKVKTDVSKIVDDLVAFTKLVPRAIPGDYLQLLVTVFVSPDTLPVAAKRSAPAALSGVRLGRAGSLGELLAEVAR